MDKVSNLIQEAKPLYIRRERQKYAIGSTLLSLCLLLGVWVAQPRQMAFDDEAFDSYFTALYLNSDTVDDFNSDEVIPTDSFGLIEVS